MDEATRPDRHRLMGSDAADDGRSPPAPHDLEANLAALAMDVPGPTGTDETDASAADETYDLPVESEGFAELARAVRAAERRRAEVRDEARRLLAEAELEKHLIRVEAQRDADAIRQDARSHAFRVREHAEQVGAQMVADADRYAVARQVEADRILREARIRAEHELAEAGRRADLLFRELLDHASVDATSTEEGARHILRTLDEARAHARDQLEQILQDLQATTARLEHEATLASGRDVPPSAGSAAVARDDSAHLASDDVVLIDLTTGDDDQSPTRTGAR